MTIRAELLAIAVHWSLHHHTHNFFVHHSYLANFFSLALDTGRNKTVAVRDHESARSRRFDHRCPIEWAFERTMSHSSEMSGHGETQLDDDRD